MNNDNRHNNMDVISIYPSVWSVIVCAAGPHSKSIRTEERWFSPEEFVKQAPLTDGDWMKNILCHCKTLGSLVNMPFQSCIQLELPVFTHLNTLK